MYFNIMIFCDIIKNFISFSYCCTDRPNHSHGVSIGTIILSDPTSEKSYSKDFCEQTSAKNPQNYDEKVTQTAENLETIPTTLFFPYENNTNGEDIDEKWNQIDNQEASFVGSCVIDNKVQVIYDFEEPSPVSKSVNEILDPSNSENFEKDSDNSEENLQKPNFLYAKMKFSDRLKKSEDYNRR